jgi:hypothetical protein
MRVPFNFKGALVKIDVQLLSVGVFYERALKGVRD